MDERYSAEPSETMAGLTREVVVANQLGLHARPAAKLAQEAQKFSSSVIIVTDGQNGGEPVDAKSILDILTLAAAHGSRLTLKAQGLDAADALNHLESLFVSRFGEER